MMLIKCPKCRGAGEIFNSILDEYIKCSKCNGKRKIQVTPSLVDDLIRRLEDLESSFNALSKCVSKIDN